MNRCDHITTERAPRLEDLNFLEVYQGFSLYRRRKDAVTIVRRRMISWVYDRDVSIDCVKAECDAIVEREMTDAMKRRKQNGGRRGFRG